MLGACSGGLSGEYLVAESLFLSQCVEVPPRAEPRCVCRTEILAHIVKSKFDDWLVNEPFTDELLNRGFASSSVLAGLFLKQFLYLEVAVFSSSSDD